jgi:hypothetical protein
MDAQWSGTQVGRENPNDFPHNPRAKSVEQVVAAVDLRLRYGGKQRNVKLGSIQVGIDMDATGSLNLQTLPEKKSLAMILDQMTRPEAILNR